MVQSPVLGNASTPGTAALVWFQSSDVGTCWCGPNTSKNQDLCKSLTPHLATGLFVAQKRSVTAVSESVTLTDVFPKSSLQDSNLIYLQDCLT